jgi:twitching motility protein PilT
MATDFVDNLMKLLAAQGGRGLRLEAGQPAQMLDASGSLRNVSTRTLTRQEILGAITPIVPEKSRPDLSLSPSMEFEYSVASAGHFKVRILGNGEQLAVSIVRNGHATVGGAPQPVHVEAPPAAEIGALHSPVAATPSPTAAISGRADTGARAQSQAEVQRVTGPVPGANGRPYIDQLFHAMCAAKASDLHISVGMPPLVRKDGEIRPLDEQAAALTPEASVNLLEPIMPEKNRTEFERRHDTDFAYEIPGLARFRANVFMDRRGRGAVFRVIPSKILTAEDLGLSAHILQLCRLNKGLVLVTGPTGSGKSTTLCGMIDYINRNRSDHIITIEDPIEFVHENKQCLMNQREVHNHTDSFKDALRAALREDPDIILVGEMRDLETVAIAIETAETGHLVFGTLHTTTAASTVDRVIDQFPTDRQSQIRIMLSESLKGVIAQTLCRKIGGGRVAALEVLIVTSAISNLIREAKTFQIPSLMQVGKGIGMVTLNDALMELVTKKLVEPQEAYSKAVDKTGFEGLLKRANIDTKFIQAAPGH